VRTADRTQCHQQGAGMYVIAARQERHTWSTVFHKSQRRPTTAVTCIFRCSPSGTDRGGLRGCEMIVNFISSSPTKAMMCWPNRSDLSVACRRIHIEVNCSILIRGDRALALQVRLQNADPFNEELNALLCGAHFNELRVRIGNS
jgi:hypothetical protein